MVKARARRWDERKGAGRRAWIEARSARGGCRSETEPTLVDGEEAGTVKVHAVIACVDKAYPSSIQDTFEAHICIPSSSANCDSSLGRTFMSFSPARLRQLPVISA